MQDSRADGDKSGRPNRAYSLAPHSTADYAWDFPAAREKKIMLVINDGHRAVDIMEIGDLIPFRFHVRDYYPTYSFLNISSRTDRQRVQYR